MSSGGFIVSSEQKEVPLFTAEAALEVGQAIGGLSLHCSCAPGGPETLVRGNPSNNRDVGSVPGHLFGMEREVAGEKCIYILMGSGKWLSWLVRGLKRARLDCQGQEDW